MRAAWSVLLIPLLSACDMDLTDISECEHREEIYETVQVGTADLLRVVAEAGDLEIRGRRGLAQVQVTAYLCADNRRQLNELDLAVNRSGGVIRVLSFVPGGEVAEAYMDLVIEVPDYMLAEIDHLQGDIDVWDIAGVSIFDESGYIRLFDIFGDVDIIDGSGNISATNVDGDVYVEEDGSGDIDVDGVGGNFIVDFDTSGRITFRAVRGRVIIPR